MKERCKVETAIWSTKARLRPYTNCTHWARLSLWLRGDREGTVLRGRDD